MQFVILALVLLYLHPIQCESDDSVEKYCKGESSHIICQNKNETCNNKNLTLYVVTKDERKKILNVFNGIRKRMAVNELEGVEEDQSHFEPYGRMLELQWEPFLEKMAKMRASVCDHSLLYDPEDVKLDDFPPGQMIASPSQQFFKEKRTDFDFNEMNATNWADWEYVINTTWKYEFKFYDYPETGYAGRMTFNNYRIFASSLYNDDYFPDFEKYHDQMFHSALQILKDDNYMIGCARSTYQEAGETVYLFACFTGPTEIVNDNQELTDPECVVPLNLFRFKPGSVCKPKQLDNILCKTTTRTAADAEGDEDVFPSVTGIEDGEVKDVPDIANITDNSTTDGDFGSSATNMHSINLFPLFLVPLNQIGRN